MCHHGPVDTTAAVSTVASLEDLRAWLGTVDFPLEAGERAAALRRADSVHHQVADYLLPRAQSLESPLTVVIGGSTGAGKSTLVNTLLQAPVTRSGVVRPTTSQPVLLHRPEDSAWAASEQLLPSLERSAEQPVDQDSLTEEHSLLLRPCPAVPQGMCLIDSPDIDSVSEANRRLSRQLLEAADLWIFVTTANRYADAVPWEVLERAAARSITLAVVLNRVPAGDGEEIAADLRRLLQLRGLAPELVTVVEEQARDEQGMLPASCLSGLHDWLVGLGADAGRRAAVAANGLSGSLRALDADLMQLEAALEEQAQTESALHQQALGPAQDALSAVEAAISNGALLRGEVLQRWQEFVGTGAWFRKIESGIGRLRDQAANYLKGSPRQARRLEDELESGLYRVVVEQAAQSGERIQRSWYRDPAGRALLAGEDLGSLPADFPERVQREIRAWQKGIIDLMSREGAGKRQRARLLSAGINSGAVVLMIMVFSMTGGLTGLEVGIAGGAGAVGWKVLEAVFGEDAVRRMAVHAREDLLRRVQALVGEVSEQFLRRLPSAAGLDLEQRIHRLQGLRSALLSHAMLPGTNGPEETR